MTNSITLDRTGSTRVAWLISLCGMDSESISRSPTLKIALSPLSDDGRGNRDNAPATAFCFDGTNLMLWSKADSMMAQCCSPMAAEMECFLGAKDSL